MKIYNNTMRERIEIGIIPDDLSHEGTIVQIANRLDDLRLAASDILQAIDNKLTVYNERLSGVREKASKLQDQLAYIQNNMSLKAIKMYSDAKYPAYETYREYETIAGAPMNKCFDTVDTNESQTALEKSLIHESMEPTIKADQYVTELNLKDRLQFYYVMSKSLPKRNSMTSMNKSPATRVSSVSALLIDDDDVPSKHSQLLQSTTNNTQQMEDAPDSINQPWHSLDFESPSYLYAPTLGEVPHIDVPAILPDLPGIVDDEKFVFDFSFQSPINPSSAVTSPTSRPDQSSVISSTKPDDRLFHLQDDSLNLPDIADQEYTSAKSQPLPPLLPPLPAISIEQSPFNVATQNLIPAQNISAATHPPPPPPPPPLSLPPPPPPPPPSLANEPHTSEQKIEIKKPITLSKSSRDDRTNLMAAIRAAGGVGKAKLRPAVSTADQPNDRWSSASVGGDLMADLHAKLSLRRKGIAGGGMGALERISRLIPPPPKPNETDRNSASEYDSQPDVDDWEE